MNLGYGAYLVFYEVCRKAFPESPTRRSRRWSRASTSSPSGRTMSSGASPGWRSSSVSPRGQGRRRREGAADSADRDRARRAVAGRLRAAKHPWFNFSYGNGLYHHHRSWIDDPTLPIAMIGSYRARMRGEDTSRPRAQVLAERDRITASTRYFLPMRFGRHSIAARPRPDRVPPHREPQLLCRSLVPHRLLEQGPRVRRAACRHGFLGDLEDIFYLRHDEVRSALDELRFYWSSGGAGRRLGPVATGPRSSMRRKPIHAAMREWAPPPSLGRAPATSRSRSTIMHWGITTERIEEWLATSAGAAPGHPAGLPGSPGVIEGVARVVP